MFDKDIKRILQKISTRCILKKEMPKFNLVISTFCEKPLKKGFNQILAALFFTLYILK